MQWHVHIYLAIWDQECLLVTDSTSSMYGPRTQMGAQQKETSLGGTLVQETLNYSTKLDPTFTSDFFDSPTCRHHTGS